MGDHVGTAERLPAGLRARERNGPVPLSFAQRRSWFLDRLDPGCAAAVRFHALRLHGALDPAALAGALASVVARHEVLRTRFPADDGEPVQVVEPAGPVPLSRVDLRHLDGNAREADARRLAGEAAAAPFDLAAGPPVRATLVRLGEEEHALFLSLHRIAADDESVEVLVRELGAAYEALAAGGAPALPPLPLQYADFALWQRERLAGAMAELELAWWRRRLAGAPPVLNVPSDRPAAAGRSRRSALVRARLPEGVAPLLRALVAEEDATPFAGLLAAWAVLLGRYAAEDDLVLGTPVAGRPHRALAGVVGPFAGMLPLRIDLGGNPTFREVVRRAHEAVQGALRHLELPFERLVEALAERDLAHAPLVQVGFALRGAEERGGARLGAVRSEPFGAGPPGMALNLDLRVTHEGDRLTAELAFQAVLFDAATAERMLAHFAALLAQAAGAPDRPIAALSLLAPEERAAAGRGWRGPVLPVPAGCVHEAFSAQAARTPDADAIAGAGERLSFAAAEARANRLAHRLRRLGVGPESRVGVCLERSAELVVALLAVLKAGGAYVPLDPFYPAERLDYMREDSGARLVLTRGPLADALEADGVELVRLDALEAELAREPDTPPTSGAVAENAAYVIYTSGSTGWPRGVVVEHRSVLSLAAGLRHALYDARGAAAPPRVAMNGSFAFDTSVKQIVQLLAGAALCPVPEEVRYGARALGAWLREERVEVLDCTPTHLRHLLAEGFPSTAHGTLTDLLLGGEALDPELWRRLGEMEGVRAWNLYGPTECTVDAVLGPVAGAWPRLGEPVANVRLHLLDPAGEPVPAGVAGELYVGGCGVARGYQGCPAATAERFVPDPFGAEPGARLYRTGDRVRRRADGGLEFLGRVDRQVKVRGFRVELGEIEDVLTLHPEVRSAAVVLRTEGEGAPRLVAYLTPAGTAVPADLELRAWIGESLPSYMQPAAFVAMDALPRTPSGKVDRRALPAPPAPPESGDAGPRGAPRDAGERCLLRVWEEVLGVSGIGVHDDYFALGGESLLGVRMLARVERETGRRIPVSALFTAPTVARLARFLGGGVVEHAAAGTASPP